MKNLLTIIAFHLAFTSYLYPQFSLDKFLDLDWSQDENSIKKVYAKTTFERKEAMGHLGINAVDTLDKLEIKFGFLFTKDNILKGKSIMNRIEEKAIAEKLFEYLTFEMTKKFGKDYKKTSAMGAKMHIWKTNKGEKIMLQLIQSFCMLTIMK